MLILVSCYCFFCFFFFLMPNALAHLVMLAFFQIPDVPEDLI